MDTSQSRRHLWILIGILVIDLLSFTCILPLFPAIIDFYAKNAADIRNRTSDEFFHGKQVDSLYSLFEWSTQRIQHFLNVPSLHRYNNVFFGGTRRFIESKTQKKISKEYSDRSSVSFNICRRRCWAPYRMRTEGNRFWCCRLRARCSPIMFEFVLFFDLFNAFLALVDRRHFHTVYFVALHRRLEQSERLDRDRNRHGHLSAGTTRSRNGRF